MDWRKIKTEYISDEKASYRRLAEKYGVPFNTLAARAKKEKWPDLKRQHYDKTVTKTLETLSDQEAKRTARLYDITDRLLDKLEKAVSELDIHLVKHCQKVKEIEYNNELRPDKPTKEIIHEEEKLVDVVTVVDRAGLKQIASALRDIKEVQMLKTELDRREQEARIAHLQRQAQKDENDAQGVEVLLGDELEEFAQ